MHGRRKASQLERRLTTTAITTGLDHRGGGGRAVIRDAQSLSLPETGHFASLEQPGRVAQILLDRAPS
jgi:pimeloyl-ACP methyl ester carboxylesterase